MIQGIIISLIGIRVENTEIIGALRSSLPEYPFS
jgi:hypothetical protein